MKFFLPLVLTSLAATANAFSAATPPKRPIRPDASAAVEEALKVTAAFGIESKEAQVAWDIVEEMNASDNRYVAFPENANTCTTILVHNCHMMGVM